MAVLIEATFPFGYVHATPWGTHVNEGAVEWPVSPWRLLRGLVATWKTRLPELNDERVLPVLDALASPPAIRMDPRTESSIRTYLPAEGHRHGAVKPDTDLVVDAFAAVAPGTGLAYLWPAELSSDQQQVLGELVAALPYLGRAESVCEASVRFDGDERGGWTHPATDASGVGRRVLVPTQPSDLSELCMRIQEMRRGGRLVPAGADWIRYEVAEALPDAPRRAVRRPRAMVRHAAQFALSGAEPVSVRQTLVVAEALRRAAMSKYGNLGGGGASEVLAGKDAEGKPLRGNRHAHWVPVDADGDGLLDTALVWATDGFDRRDVAALGAIRQLRFHGGDGMRTGRTLDVGLEIVVDELSDPRLGLGGVGGRSSRWRSATPFLPQRHRARDDVDTWLHGCVARELAARGIDAAFELVPDRSTSWGSFRRYRRQERLHQARPGFGFELRFERSVSGPISIGALSHFGMGRFEVA